MSTGANAPERAAVEEAAVRRRSPGPAARQAARAASRNGAPDEFADRFDRHLRESGLLAEGDVVLVALSGGRDSVVLLHLLRFPLAHWRLHLHAAHFDHRMRPDSTADADWTAGLCTAWEIPLLGGCARTPLRSEADARDARYEFLQDAADRARASRILTAHHADDQAETVLFRAIRGTALRGLAGIPERRGRIVRPLLPFRRAEIAAYAARHRISFREDPTNRSLTYTRNRIRHEIMPRLESIAPGATRSLTRLAEHVREAELAWDDVLERLESGLLRETAEGIELARDELLSYHPHVRARVLRRALLRFGPAAEHAGTRAALEFINSGSSGSRVTLPGGIRIAREFDRIRIEPVTPRPEGMAADRRVVIQAPGDGAGIARVGGRRVAVRWWTGERAEGEGESFDIRALRFPLEVRGWRPGDRITLPYGTKKLKKLFAERRIGVAERARTAVLADAEGRVLWIPGVARARFGRAVPGHPCMNVAVRVVDR